MSLRIISSLLAFGLMVHSNFADTVITDGTEEIKKTLRDVLMEAKKRNSLKTFRENDEENLTSLPRTLAEKVFYVPLSSPPLERFLIDMGVELSYVDGKENIKGLITSKVNAKLTDELGPQLRSENSSGHFEYLSPHFQLSGDAIPVGLQLFIPIQKTDDKGEK